MKDRIKQNDMTGRWHIDGGPKGYKSSETALNALANYEKRVRSAPMNQTIPAELPHKDDKGKLG